jgi:hypothetical protein
MHGSNRYRAPHPCPDCGSGPLSGTLYCPPRAAGRQDEGVSNLLICYR